MKDLSKSPTLGRGKQGSKMDMMMMMMTLPSTIVFKLGNVLFYHFYANISTFSIKKCSVQLLSTTC